MIFHVESDGDEDETEDVSFEDAHNYENQLGSEDDEIENLMTLDAILDEEVNSAEKNPVTFSFARLWRVNKG